MSYLQQNLKPQYKNINNKIYNLQKSNSPPISPKIKDYNTFQSFNTNIHSKFIFSPENHIQKNSSPQNNVKIARTPTDKYSIPINSNISPQLISEKKYFKAINSQVYNSTQKLHKNLFLNPNNIDKTKQSSNNKKEYINDQNLVKNKYISIDQPQKTQRMKFFEISKQQIHERNKQAHNYKFDIENIKQKSELISIKKSNGSESQYPNSTSNSKMEQNTYKNYKIKQNKICKSDFISIKYMGKGKFGQVHMVRHKYTGFIAALKSIKKSQIIQAKLINQLIRQLKIQSYLDHPNIIKFYGTFQDKQNIYVLLQLGSQGQLYTKLKQKQQYSQQAAAFIIKSLLSAINYMHIKKLLHRDIKPENIVIVHGIVKLCDFGWAVYRGNDMRTTFCGTPLYVSPQVLKGQSYDEKTDLWAVGILAYQLVIGDIPFQISCEQQLKKIINDDIKFPSNIQVSQEFKDFVLKILKKNPKLRLKSLELLNHPFIIRYNQFQTCQQLCDK